MKKAAEPATIVVNGKGWGTLAGSTHSYDDIVGLADMPGSSPRLLTNPPPDLGQVLSNLRGLEPEAGRADRWKYVTLRGLDT